MAGNAAIRTSNEAANILKDVWDSQFALDPTEEAVFAPLVSQPVGGQNIGNKLHLRKIAAQATQTAKDSTAKAQAQVTRAKAETARTIAPVGRVASRPAAPPTPIKTANQGAERALEDALNFTLNR